MNAWKTEVLLPCDCGKKHGKITVCRLREKLIVLLIDIRSRYIPEILLPEEKREYQSKTLSMNYCFQGRCELQLHSGEATFLNGGEFALDSGNAVQENQKFFYPLSHYEGIEICMQPEALPKDFDCRETAGTLLHTCDELGRPYFASNNDKIQSLMSTIREDIISDGPRDLLMLDIFRLLILANQLPFDKEERRTYFTPAQVEIAEKTMELLTSDLSRRTSAAAMAENFGVSETSLKNYFRAVYGQSYDAEPACGFFADHVAQEQIRACGDADGEERAEELTGRQAKENALLVLPDLFWDFNFFDGFYLPFVRKFDRFLLLRDNICDQILSLCRFSRPCGATEKHDNSHKNTYGKSRKMF